MSNSIRAIRVPVFKNPLMNAKAAERTAEISSSSSTDPELSNRIVTDEPQVPVKGGLGTISGSSMNPVSDTVTSCHRRSGIQF